MSSATERGDRPALVAIAGNPNVGKTSVFNRLTGSSQKVTNYPGVTVERFEGSLLGGGSVRVLDVPGTYSLSARSPEEEIAIRAIAGLAEEDCPDLVVVVVDATQLSRNLYLALQIRELGVPVVLAITMGDLCTGRRPDAAALTSAFGVPALEVSGLDGSGVDELQAEILRALEDRAPAAPSFPWEISPELNLDIDAVAPHLPAHWDASTEPRRSALALWSLLSLDDEDELVDIPADLRAAAAARIAAPERDIERETILARYACIDAVMGQFGRIAASSRKGTERADSVLLHPLFGFLLFLGMMTIVFQALFTWSGPAIDLVESVFGSLARAAQNALPAGILRDFLTEGLITGVGSVVVFLPQILLLFLFIGLMEDTGYMARVAFLMDRVMRAVGLNGRAFVPMMSGFACAIPAILATRTMERRRDRYLTMMVIPLMTCSARLPVYTLIIGALFPVGHWLGMPLQGLLMAAMYLFSVLVALLASAVLSRTLFTGPSVPLLLELPPYRRPHIATVLRMMWQRSSLFLKEAGGVILVCTIGLWLLLSFPSSAPNAPHHAAARAEAESTLSGEALTSSLATINSTERRDQLHHSYAGRLGRAFEPAIEPLGFDWKIGVGLIGAFAAREVFVSTMGLVYGLSEDVDQDPSTLRDKLRTARRANGDLVYTPLVGLSLLVFIALACQCMSTLAAVRRETATYRWPIFMFVYMTALAWGMSFVVYQGGRAIGFE
jgi:ferrous iron transport protein B